MKHTARRSIAKAVLETLEGRSCLSATIGLHDGVLSVVADPNVASTMQVQYTADHNSVRAFTNWTAATYSKSQIHEIVMIGSQYNDSIYIDPALRVNAIIEGGAGNDTIKGGSGIDTIDGGAGDDLIYGTGFLAGGTGNDTIWGGNYNNIIVGGSGNSLLVGGNDNDTIFGGSGNDTVYGGGGNDLLVSENGASLLAGGVGANTLMGGNGNDTLMGQSGQDHLIARRRNVFNATQHDVVQQVADLPDGPSIAPPAAGSTIPTVAPTPTPPVVVTPTPRTPKPPTPPSPTPTPPTTGNPNAPTAVITTVQNTVLAGEGIEVNGLNSVLHTGDPLTAHYHWDFGDPSGAYDQLDGFNAGHVYDEPGVYTVSLRVTDANGLSSQATTQVTIGSDNRPVIYVDTHGSDSNDGSSPNEAVATAARAFELAGDNDKVEFHRGETFNVDTALQISSDDVYVGAYGSGANPVIKRGAGDGECVLFLTPQAQNVTVQDITFDSIYAPVNGVAPKIPVCAVWASGTNVVVRDCTFLNVDDAVDGETRPTGVIVMDNTAPLLTGLRSYFTWVDGTDWSILGNTVANTTREHVIRANSVTAQRVLIADNNLTNTVNPQDSAEVPKCTINFRAGSYIYITDNTLSDGTLGFGPGPWTPATDAVEYLAIVDNKINYAQVYIAGAVHHALVANNVLNLQGSAQVIVNPIDPAGYASRYMSDITVTQNTGINLGATGNFLEVQGAARPGAITLTNNLYSAPNLVTGANMAAAVLVDTTNLNGFAVISGNVWPAGGTHADGAVNYVAGSWFANGWETPQQWNAQSVVQNDTFQDVTLPSSVYALALSGTTAGAAEFTVAA